MSIRSDAGKQKLLKAFAKTPIVQIACKQAEVSRATYYRWRNEDNSFAEAADEALIQSANLVNDMAEAQLVNAIKDGNLTAVMYWLNHRHRVYAPRLEIYGHTEHHLSDEDKELLVKALKRAQIGADHEQPA